MFYATSMKDIPDKDSLLSMSGLEFMQGILRGTVPAPPISKLLNYRLDVVEDGRVVFEGQPQFDHTNPMGTVHGGWYGTILDSCMACAVMTKVPKGSIYTTLEYKINITRSIPLDMSVIAEGVVQHSGRSTGVATGTLKGAEDGKVYATASTTCIIMKMS